MTKSFKDYLSEQIELNEKLITFGGKAYPKFGNIVILAGGAGSGKGFVLERLLGIEGKVFDVDALKTLAQSTPAIIDAVKKEFGVDISKDTFSLKDPANTFKLHTILQDRLKLVDKHKEAIYQSILLAPKDRLPNLIFDVTLKDIRKFYEIIESAKLFGYDKSDIHIVWVINDVEVAVAQNAKRSRTVPEDILMMTHVGAAMTMKTLLEKSDELQSLMDGDIVFAFNKVKVDSELATSDTKGSYVKEANYIYVKRKGHKPLTPNELGIEVLKKIAEYTPSPESWQDLLAKKTT